MSTENTREAGVDQPFPESVFSSDADEATPAASIIYAAPNAASNPLRQYEWQLDGYLTPGSNTYGANVDLISAEYSGAGVRVGIIDEGFDLYHPDLANRFDLATSYDPRDVGVTNIRPDSASNVHGTWVAGVLGAEDDDNFGMIGVAPDATLVGYVARFGLGGSLRAEMADLLARQVNVDISNNSWGYTTQFADNFLDPSWAQMRDALRFGVTEGREGLGTVYVFAAGNDRQYTPNSLTYDGDNTNYHALTNSRMNIVTAASTPDGHIASFSAPGASILVTAPGVAVLSTMLVHGDPANAFGLVSGTSFAAPVVSGVVAMMLEANPLLGYRDVQEILAMSARVIDPASASWSTNGATNWNGGGHNVSHDFGFGLVDAHAAVRLAETWTTQHTADNEAVISVAGAVGSNGALADFQPKQYQVTVAPTFESFSIDWVEVDVSLAHSHIGDLRIHLISPDGTDSLLLDRPGAGTNPRNDLQFTFSTNHAWGESPVGTWTLVVEDSGTGGSGSLVSFALRFFGDDEGHNDTYFYTDDFATLSGDRGTLTDHNGNDTINAAAITTDLSIDLTPGATSTIAGGPVLISSGTVIENVYGGDGNDTITGNDAGNRIYGGHGNDVLSGGAGADVLVGGAGADTLIGGTGDDTYVIDSFDTLIENAGEGIDTVTVAVSYVLAANFENLTLAEEGGAIDGTGNTLDNMLIGNASANVLAGADGNDTLDGRVGADTLIGGLGDDTYYVDDAGDVVIEQSGEGTDTVIALIDYVLAGGLENLTLAAGAGAIAGTGNSQDNRITGNASDNRLDGGTGADTLIGGGGNDTYYIHDAAARVIELAGEGTDTVIADVDYELPANVETLILTGAATLGTVRAPNRFSVASAGEDNIALSADDLAGHTLVANAAVASTLVGGLGDDLLVGAKAVGGSELSGGDGDDGYVVFSAGDRIDEQSGAGSDTVYARVDYTLAANVETLYLLGSATHGTGNDGGCVLIANPGLSSTLVGGAAADVFVGSHAAASTMIGGGGNDIYIVFASGDLIQENANGGNDTVYARADYTLAANIETLYLVGAATHGTANDTGATLIANAELASTLNGGAGSDLLIGSHAATTAHAGGAGDDVYIVFNSGDAIIEAAGGGNDTVYALADFSIGDNIEILFLAGSATHARAHDHGATLVANASLDSVLTGGAGDDLLVGGHTSTTVMIGGNGNDTFVVFNAADTIQESWNGGGADQVVSYVDYVLPENIETLILHPSAGAIDGTGNAAGNAIVGNASANVIDGRGGADALVGNGGEDTFVFHRGEADGDMIVDFNDDIFADHLQFVGYGSAADGASFTQVDETHWSINSADGLAHDIVTFNNAAAIHQHDFVFV